MNHRLIPAGALLLATMACGHDSSPERSTSSDNAFRPPAPEESAPASAEDSKGVVHFDAMAGDADGDQAMATRSAGPTVGAAISSSAAGPARDTAHRFIRTADLHFRVKDVVQATLAIEDIVGAHQGWVTKTALRSEPRSRDLIPMSEDSVLEISRYLLKNTITLRVPNEELDSTLRSIGRWVDLFEHRDILADDIRLRLMANAMAVRRARAHALRVATAIDDQGRKLKETLVAEEALQASEERRDKGLLDNLELADHVAFSTVTLTIYQRETVRKEMIANERSINGYRPSFARRIGDALGQGWALLEVVITGLLSIWPLLVVMGAAIWLILRKRKRVPVAQPPPVPPHAGA